MEPWKQLSNNNRLIEVQNYGGLQQSSGSLTVTYFAHAAFKFVSPHGLEMLVDPWRNDPSRISGDWFLREFPETNTDIGFSTHAHFDHDAFDRIEAGMLLDRFTGRFELGDVVVTGIADKHTCNAKGHICWTNVFRELGFDPEPPNNPAGFDNHLLLIETAGMRVLVWGDNRPDPPEQVWQQITDIDVLVLPIDEFETFLLMEEVDRTLERTGAKIVIPCHYHMKGITLTHSMLGTADEWVASRPHTRLDRSTVEIRREHLTGKKGHVLYFGDISVLSDST
ncbi:MAG: MBL fold metallo-hydrolase [Rhodospirillaceae bacterium]|nr:MBL fold metallo-hydrolase [Rhodospirillaceae bacterium]